MKVIKNIEELKTAGYDTTSIEEAIQWNRCWEHFFSSEIGPFLSEGDPPVLWKNPDFPLLDTNTIARNVENLVPDSILFRHLLLPVWTSIGGNVLAYHPKTKAFYWADHSCIFGTERVLIPKTYKELPFNQENLMKALIRVSEDDCRNFLTDLRDGKHDAELDKLD